YGSANLNAVVGGTGIANYRYALLSGASDCSAATYTAWAPVSTPLSAAIGADGAKLLCLLGEDSELNVQATPTTYAWTQQTTATLSLTAGASGALASSGL